MPDFYIGENDVQRCKESRDKRRTIAITGLTTDGRKQEFSGVVLAVQHDVNRERGQHWRVTMSDKIDK